MTETEIVGVTGAMGTTGTAVPNRNHPPKGAKLWKSPIKNIDDVERIANILRPCARNHAIFLIGVNTNLRASDLCALTVGDVRGLKVGDALMLKDQKPNRYVIRAANKTLVGAVQRLLAEHPRAGFASAPLFLSQRGGPIEVSSLSRLVKSWCKRAKLRGRYGSHSLRKTWAYHALNTFGVEFHIVSAALGHRDHGTTLTYLGIPVKAIKAAFMNELGGPR